MVFVLQTGGSWQRRRNAAAKLDHLSQFLPDFSRFKS